MSSTFVSAESAHVQKLQSPESNGCANAILESTKNLRSIGSSVFLSWISMCKRSRSGALGLSAAVV